ncbi:PHM/PNGase F domain-containing protein [Pavlovales sp. CCMP2436]|nr:PHM/PNGase F domain-containing protein [Pavlovales sp. CCMP2436]
MGRSAIALVACACARAATLEVRLEGGHLVVAHKDAIYEVAPSHDVYSCSWADLSSIKGGATIDQIERAIEPASVLSFYHHISLYMCNSDVRPDRAHAAGEPFDCLVRPTFSGCERQLFTWGAGMERFEMPPGTGFILPRLAILQVHVKHPSLDGEPIEVAASLSGLRLRLSAPDVKPFQYFQLGPHFGMLSVPPRAPRYKVGAVCAESCIRQALRQAKVEFFEVIAIRQHMHLLGSAAVTELIHADGSTENYGLVRNFSAYNTPISFLPTPLYIRAGDALQVTCVYNSSARAHATMLGVSMHDEMCFSFMIMHPPLPNFTGCWHANENFVHIPGAPCVAICGIIPKRQLARQVRHKFKNGVKKFTLPRRGPWSRAALDPVYADLPDLKTCATPDS